MQRHNIPPTSDRPSTASARSGQDLWRLIVALFLVGINLRPALSSVASVLPSIRDSTGLSSSGAGLLGTLPVLCFGLFAPFAPRLAARYGAERVVFHGLIALAASLSLRLVAGTPLLFASALGAGASIGIIMVLLPGIIKRDFAARAHGMTGVYTTALCLGAALAAGLTVPLAHVAGDSWRTALAFWLVPALAAALLWRPHVKPVPDGGPGSRRRAPDLYANRLAWQVTAYLGLQSVLAYCIFSWMPTILVDRGMTPLAAGSMLSLSISMQLVTALAAPWLVGLGRDQRLAVVGMMALSLAGFLGCMYAGLGAMWVWAVLLGLGQGGSFSIGMTLIVLRAPDSAVAASLSAMAQGVGYSAASVGPFAFGFLRDLSGNWNSAALFFAAVALAAMIAGWGAGRNMHVVAANPD